MNIRPTSLRITAASAGLLTLGLSAGAAVFFSPPMVQIGSDLNSALNPFVQPQDSAQSGGGRDQTLQFGDVLEGTGYENLLIGRLGTDLLFGGPRNDVLVGGTEHFNPSNRDRAFGGRGQDVFLWSPGDGSDLFEGGGGVDAVVFGLIGELENGQVQFRVSTDQQAGDVYIDPITGLPQIDVTNSPGFCEIIDPSSSHEAGDELEDLGLDHLVRFFIRSVADDFENGVQDTDNGLRVTLHLKDVEVLVCTDRDGGFIEAYNLTVSPPQPIPFSWAAARVPQLADMVR